MSGTSWTARVPEWIKRPVRLLRSSAERQDYRHERRRRRRGEPELPPGPIRRIVVICHGNICRSPFAGRDLARRLGRLEGVEVRTAGLEAGDANPPEPHARTVAAAMGVPLDGHASRRFDATDVAWADLVVAMQGRHLHTLERRWPGSTGVTRLLGDYLTAAPHLLEDPWGQDRAAFESVFERIARANERLAELVVASHASASQDVPSQDGPSQESQETRGE